MRAISMRSILMRSILGGVALGSLALFSLFATEAVAEGDAKAGAELYKTNCARCHGDGGKGDGPTAEKLKDKVKFPDFTNKAAVSQLPDDYFVRIITDGGKAIGKSPIMPSFGEKLSEGQIKDIITFVRSLAH